MDARGSTSRKGLGASCGPATQRDLVFFTDKNLGLYIVPNALRAAGATVEIKTDHFSQDCPDHEWLKAVGDKQWIVLSKDKNLQHNLIEIIALLRSNTHSFLLTSGNFTGPEMANAFVKALPHMNRMVAKFPPPFVGIVSKSGEVRVGYTADDLMKKAANGLAADAPPISN